MSDDDYRVWRADGSYLGRFIPDDDDREDQRSGNVFGPHGRYVADVSQGRVRVELGKGLNGMSLGHSEESFQPRGGIAPALNAQDEQPWPMPEGFRNLI